MFKFHKAALLALSFFCAAPVAVHAAVTDPAAQKVDALDAALLDTMKNAKQLGIKGRYDKLAPVIDKTFNISGMVSVAVGSYWGAFSAEDKKKVITSFRNYTISNYASNFDGYSGQRFEINPEIVSRGTDKIVRTQLLKDGDKPVNLTYRMHETGGDWKIVDIYYLGSISQLAMQRSEFASTLANGGADALAKKLDGLSANMMKDK